MNEGVGSDSKSVQSERGTNLLSRGREFAGIAVAFRQFASRNPQTFTQSLVLLGKALSAVHFCAKNLFLRISLLLWFLHGRLVCCAMAQVWPLILSLFLRKKVLELQSLPGLSFFPSHSHDSWLMIAEGRPRRWKRRVSYKGVKTFQPIGGV